MLIAEPWPTTMVAHDEHGAAFDFLRELVTVIRQVRNEDKIEPKVAIDVVLVPGNDQERVWVEDPEIRELCIHFGRTRELRALPSFDGTPRATVRSTALHVTPVA